MSDSSKSVSDQTNTEISSKSDRDPALPVVPVRFDSAPTRIRFDSVPTRVRLSTSSHGSNSGTDSDSEKRSLSEYKRKLNAKSKTETMQEKSINPLEVENNSSVIVEKKKNDERETEIIESKITKTVIDKDENFSRTTVHNKVEFSSGKEGKLSCVADKEGKLSCVADKEGKSGHIIEKGENHSSLSEEVANNPPSVIKSVVSVSPVEISDEKNCAPEVQAPTADKHEQDIPGKNDQRSTNNAEGKINLSLNHSLEEISDESEDESAKNSMKKTSTTTEVKESVIKSRRGEAKEAQHSPDNRELPVLEKYDVIKINEDESARNVEMQDVESPPRITDCEGTSMEIDEAPIQDISPCNEKPEGFPNCMEVDADANSNKIKECKVEKDNESDSEVTFLAISDVRTVDDECATVIKDGAQKDEDKKHVDITIINEENSTCASIENANNSSAAKTDENPSVVDVSEAEESPSKDEDGSLEKLDHTEKGRGIDAIAKKLVKEKSDSDEKKESDKKEHSQDSEAEIKTFATDTMNELLGLFGYDKMDDSVKDNLQLKSSISGNSSNDQTADETSKDNEQESSPDGEKAKVISSQAPNTSKSVGRLCTECNQVKGCKYQVLMHGNARYLCDDNCFKLFRSRQKLTTAITSTPENRPQTRSVTSPKDYCNVCRKEIKNGQGFLLGVGENKPLCSEECMRKFQTIHAPKRACAQCGNAILGRNKCLTWETMEFCNEECLGKYQSYLGSHCACCNNAVQRTSLGKYCVRFGSDIKQFCSNNCLEEFKKGLKVCSFCLKDISSGIEGFLAPVGDKGQFKDFCSQQCMEKYETMNSTSNSQPSIHQCSVCNKTAPIKVQVMFEGKSHKLCSEPCIAAFRYANKISTSICDTCHKFFDMEGSQQHTIQFEGLSKRFCAKTCMNVFVLSHRKIVPCTWCKVKKYNFDMIERVDSNNHVQLFCSLNCLSLFRVSLNATSSRSVRCDFCQHSRPAQYHLTMSDASIRNFCSYQCVMSFQSQFTNMAPVTPSSPVPPPALSTGAQANNNNGTPVISSVVSLAPSQQNKAPATTRQTTSTVTSSSTVSLPATTTTTTTTMTTTSTSSSSSPPAPSLVSPITTSVAQVTQQVIIKPPPPKQLKNKALLCKPFLQTKGVSCKPHPCHKTTQTDEEEPAKPVLIPVPVPIYVPMPMHMYVNPAPFPLAFPLPIPVPIFIPTSKNSAAGIMKHIKEIQDKIPENPFEAELLMMAEMVAANSDNKNNKEENSNNSTPGDSSTANDVEQGGHDGVESQLQDPLHATNAFSDDMLQMALRMATEMDEPAMDLETALASGTPQQQQQQESDYNSLDDNSDLLSPRELRARTRSQKRAGGSGRGRGRKKARVEEQAPQTPPGILHVPESNSVLKFSYGVNAWKHWVLQKNTQLEKASQTNRRLKLFKTDLLQLTADELNYSLCLFVKEVRKPNGEEYAPDSIFYLCLGIQQYLFDNGRIDNIFTDAYYEKFTECLNEVLQKHDNALAEGCMLSRIEEEILWEAKQLGAHSPHVLLNTLMYFNTKFFMLKSVEDHMKLSFSHVMKHWKKSPGAGRGNSNNSARNVLLRYCPPASQKPEVGRKRKDDQSPFEQLENVDNPLRCPVKLYEFYLSKCPESIKNRSDVFYLYPERSCVPDSPVWYSTMPLGREAVAKMLQRIKMVREVCDILITN